VLTAEHFLECCHGHGIRFVAGVPDSLLKDLCACLTDTLAAGSHLIAANEGGAVGLAAGHYLATGQPALVYMQNSGQGNAVNPLVSLADPLVYGIPMLLLVGWRGEPGKHDEPQHAKQGRITAGLFDALGVHHEILTEDEAALPAQIQRLLDYARANTCPVGLIVRSGTFAKYAPRNRTRSPYAIGREAAIEALLGLAPPAAAFVSTTGHISREVYDTRMRHGDGHERDFLVVGSMGHASQIALGLALAQPLRPVICLDGDGAALMHLGGLAIVGTSGCRNLKHVVLNNGAHESVGGQPTVAFKVSLTGVATAAGYAWVRRVTAWDDWAPAVAEWLQVDGPAFLEVCVASGARADLGRPKTTPAENKSAFMAFVGAAPGTTGPAAEAQ